MLLWPSSQWRFLTGWNKFIHLRLVLAQTVLLMSSLKIIMQQGLVHERMCNFLLMFYSRSWVRIKFNKHRSPKVWKLNQPYHKLLSSSLQMPFFMVTPAFFQINEISLFLPPMDVHTNGINSFSPSTPDSLIQAPFCLQQVQKIECYSWYSDKSSCLVQSAGPVVLFKFWMLRGFSESNVHPDRLRCLGKPPESTRFEVAISAAAQPNCPADGLISFAALFQPLLSCIACKNSCSQLSPSGEGPKYCCLLLLETLTNTK